MEILQLVSSLGELPAVAILALIVYFFIRYLTSSQKTLSASTEKTLEMSSDFNKRVVVAIDSLDKNISESIRVQANELATANRVIEKTGEANIKLVEAIQRLDEQIAKREAAMTLGIDSLKSSNDLHYGNIITQVNKSGELISAIGEKVTRISGAQDKILSEVERVVVDFKRDIDSNRTKDLAVIQNQGDAIIKSLKKAQDEIVALVIAAVDKKLTETSATTNTTVYRPAKRGGTVLVPVQKLTPKDDM